MERRLLEKRARAWSSDGGGEGPISRDQQGDGVRVPMTKSGLVSRLTIDEPRLQPKSLMQRKKITSAGFSDAALLRLKLLASRGGVRWALAGTPQVRPCRLRARRPVARRPGQSPPHTALEAALSFATCALRSSRRHHGWVRERIRLARVRCAGRRAARTRRASRQGCLYGVPADLTLASRTRAAPRRAHERNKPTQSGSRYVYPFSSPS